MAKLVKKAIIPAAGYGIRMMPISKVIPKEMLPFGEKPVLEHIIIELKHAKITEIAIVINEKKELIKEYFGNGSNWEVKLEYLYQKEMNGPVEAIRLCKDWINDGSFVVAFADCVVRSEKKPDIPLARLIKAYCDNVADIAVLGEYVNNIKERIKKGELDYFQPYKQIEARERCDIGYGIICRSEKKIINNISHFRIYGSGTNSRKLRSAYIAAARWVLNPDVFRHFDKIKPRGGERILSDIIQVLEKKKIIVVPLKKNEERIDMGTWKHFYRSNLLEGLKNAEFRMFVKTQLNMYK